MTMINLREGEAGKEGEASEGPAAHSPVLTPGTKGGLTSPGCSEWRGPASAQQQSPPSIRSQHGVSGKVKLPKKPCPHLLS
jgi:hypothetical protein